MSPVNSVPRWTRTVGHGTATAVELGLDHRAFAVALLVGAQVHDLGLELQALQQVGQTVAGLGRDLEFQGLAAHRLDLDVVLQEFRADPLRVRVRLVDLVDRDDERDARRLGVLNRLDGLGHHAVIGRHHDHDDVRHLGAAGAHGGEGRVAGVSMKVMRSPDGADT